MDKPAAPAALEVDEGVADGLRFFGAREEDIAAQQAGKTGEGDGPDPDEEDVYEVHADVWDNWLFFLKVQRQWVFVPVSAGMGVSAQRMSLNWGGVRSVMLLCGVKRSAWSGLVDDLLVIEETVLKEESDARAGSNE